MFSDTHFHFPLTGLWHLEESEAGENSLYDFTEPQVLQGKKILEELGSRNTFFGMDIGTRSYDLEKRQHFAAKVLETIDNLVLRQKCNDLLYFSAGIWPDVEAIKDRNRCMEELRSQIEAAEKNGFGLSHPKVVAIGEGGIDHHWNPSGVDGRCESDFDQSVYDGEKELFCMQLDLAKKMDLPFVIHSRDGFEETLDCVKAVGHNKGILHCCSYGLEEVKKFLDLGWHISFSGSVTYTKKRLMDDMKSLLNYIPEDRLLLETDSPYLAPVPFRGQKNSPVLVEHVYRFVADMCGMEAEQLSELVDGNIRVLFGVGEGSR